MKLLKRSQIVAVLALAVWLGGCSATPQGGIAPTPTTITQTEQQAWAKAVDYFGTIETARHTANQIALTLSRMTPPKVPVAVLTSFANVDTAAIKANKLLQASPNTFSQPLAVQVIALANQILTELTQWDSAAAAQPTLAAPLTQMETAARGVVALR